MDTIYTSSQISRHGKHRDGYYGDYRKVGYEKIRASNRKFREGWRKKTLMLMGDKCVECGFSDPRALQIDHVNGHGGNARRKWGESYYKKIFTEIKDGSSEYQLLCANCNFIKRYTHNELAIQHKKYG